MLVRKTVITKPNIFTECFEEPLKLGCDRLSMVSGWISSHLMYQDLQNLMTTHSIPVDLVALHGMKIKWHDYPHLKDLDSDQTKILGKTEIFAPVKKTGKTIKSTLTHEKIYVWSKDEEPIRAYSGSANFTQRGLRDSIQNENLWEVDTGTAYERIQELLKDAVRIKDLTEPKDIEKAREAKATLQPVVPDSSWPTTYPPASTNPKVLGLPYEDVPLFNTRKPSQIRSNSGINMGVSKTGRVRTDVDAAQISIGPTIIPTGFFPSHGGSCRLECLSTGDVADATVVGQGGKDLSTTDNQVLGRWLRRYLGVKSGVYVDTTPSNLGQKSYVRIYKLAHDYFILDL